MVQPVVVPLPPDQDMETESPVQAIFIPEPEQELGEVVLPPEADGTALETTADEAGATLLETTGDATTGDATAGLAVVIACCVDGGDWPAVTVTTGASIMTVV